MCRAATCDCDKPEYCNAEGQCPDDVSEEDGTTCGAPIDDVCQGQSTCRSGQCEPVFHSSEKVCRPAAGPCDVVEYCSGISAGCADDTHKPNGSTCGTNEDMSLCQLADHCMDGECIEKPAPENTECRPADGDCTEPSFCDGKTAGVCPENPHKNDGTSCGPAIDDLCQDQSQCSSGKCVDVFKPSSTVCRPADGPCDVADTCSGSSAGCEDKKAPKGQTCRKSIDEGCDPAEYCDGNSNECPEDAIAEDYESCGTDHNLPCQGHDHCISGVCSPNFMPKDHECRGSMDGECDPAEYCTGDSGECPHNAWNPDGMLCGDSFAGAACQSHDSCSNGHCVHNYVAAGTECRAADGPCDVPETCDGSSAACPDDQFADKMTVCREKSATNDCDVEEFCNGSSPECPEDFVEPDEFSFKCGTVNYLCGNTLEADGGGTCNDGRNVKTETPSDETCAAFLAALDQHQGMKTNIYNWKCPNGAGVSHYTLYDCHGVVGSKFEADGCGKDVKVELCDPEDLIENEISCTRRNLRTSWSLF